MVLGLISRSEKGCRRLSQEGWDSAPSPGTAVAIPQNVSDLFRLDKQALYLGSPVNVGANSFSALAYSSVAPTSSPAPTTPTAILTPTNSLTPTVAPPQSGGLGSTAAVGPANLTRLSVETVGPSDPFPPPPTNVPSFHALNRQSSIGITRLSSIDIPEPPTEEIENSILTLIAQLPGTDLLTDSLLTHY